MGDDLKFRKLPTIGLAWSIMRGYLYMELENAKKKYDGDYKYLDDYEKGHLQGKIDAIEELVDMLKEQTEFQMDLSKV